MSQMIFPVPCDGLLIIKQLGIACHDIMPTIFYEPIVNGIEVGSKVG